MATEISFSDYLEIRNVAFEWAESYDNKDWQRLQQCLAPSADLDFRGFGGPLHEQLAPEAFVAVLSGFLGDRLLKTQHLLGAAKWKRSEDGTVSVWYQVRAAHQRYADEDLTLVLKKGHSHGVTRHSYKKVEGTWKLEGVMPGVSWSEYDLLDTIHPGHKNTPVKERQTRL